MASEAELLADGWTKWDGGSVSADPLGPSRINVRFRCGTETTVNGDELCWSHNGKGADVIAYRRARAATLSNEEPNVQ